MEEEKGFYKLEVGAKRSLVLFSTHLESANFTLDISLKDTYTYPIDDWRYFDTYDEACEFYNIDKEEYREDLFPTKDLI